MICGEKLPPNAKFCLKYGMCFLTHSIDSTLVIVKRFKLNIFNRNKEKNAYEAIILSQIDDKTIPALLGIINQKGFYGFVLEFKSGYTVKDILFKYKHQFNGEEFFNIGT